MCEHASEFPHLPKHPAPLAELKLNLNEFDFPITRPQTTPSPQITRISSVFSEHTCIWKTRSFHSPPLDRIACHKVGGKVHLRVQMSFRLSLIRASQETNCPIA